MSTLDIRSGVKLYMKRIGQSLLCILCLCMVYTFLLTIVFCFDAPSLQQNVQEGVAAIEKEGINSPIIYDSYAFTTDNYTDSLILKIAGAQAGESSVQTAMVPSYARYWHGYAVIVRPLLMFVGYHDLRMLMMFLFTVFVTISALALRRSIGELFSGLFVLSFFFFAGVMIPVCLQFFPAFCIALIGMLFSLYFCEMDKQEKLPFLFLIVGSVINFIDFLTVPLVTLGIPMIVVMLVQKNRFTHKAEPILRMVEYSAFWCIGYAFTWIAKWLIGSLILQKNVITDAMDSAAFRISGNEVYNTSILGALFRNMGTWLASTFVYFAFACLVFLVIALFDKRHKSGFSQKYCIIALIGVAVIAVWGVGFLSSLIEIYREGAEQIQVGTIHILSCFLVAAALLICLIGVCNKVHKKVFLTNISLLLIACYPYIWYAVLSNHSQIHFPFTFRAQIISVLAFFGIWTNLLDTKTGS